MLNLHALQDNHNTNEISTSVLVHELRNPLTILKSTLQLIEKKEPNIKSIKYWDQIDCLISDMENIMCCASESSNFQAIDVSSVDLFELFIELYNNFKPFADSQGIKLIMNINEDFSPILTNFQCDRGCIKQVLSNIVKNAFDATVKGNYISIDILQCSHENNTNNILISIVNNGAPIPHDLLGDIFSPFVSHKLNGNGIGLALSKKIINLHKGDIKVTSEKKITNFTISLPFDDDLILF
ncbi:MAG TPA: hypothetical protein GXZ90_07695 [Clostridiales bacterium]|nr:hypothetical protein [Clostridiales bacterium]